MTEYTYKSWERQESIANVMDDVKEIYKQEWKIVSHSHSSFGMSIIFEKEPRVSEHTGRRRMKEKMFELGYKAGYKNAKEAERRKRKTK